MFDFLCRGEVVQQIWNAGLVVPLMGETDKTSTTTTTTTTTQGEKRCLGGSKQRLTEERPRHSCLLQFAFHQDSSFHSDSCCASSATPVRDAVESDPSSSRGFSVSSPSTCSSSVTASASVSPLPGASYSSIRDGSKRSRPVPHEQENSAAAPSNSSSSHSMDSSIQRCVGIGVLSVSQNSFSPLIPHPSGGYAMKCFGFTSFFSIDSAIKAKSSSSSSSSSSVASSSSVSPSSSAASAPVSSVPEAGPRGEVRSAGQTALHSQSQNADASEAANSPADVHVIELLRIPDNTRNYVCLGSLLFCGAASAARCTGMAVELADVAEEDDELEDEVSSLAPFRVTEAAPSEPLQAVPESLDIWADPSLVPLTASKPPVLAPKYAPPTSPVPPLSPFSRWLASVKEEWNTKGSLGLVNQGVLSVYKRLQLFFLIGKECVCYDIKTPRAFAVRTWDQTLHIGGKATEIGFRCEQIVRNVVRAAVGSESSAVEDGEEDGEEGGEEDGEGDAS